MCKLHMEHEAYHTRVQDARICTIVACYFSIVYIYNYKKQGKFRLSMEEIFSTTFLPPSVHPLCLLL